MVQDIHSYEQTQQTLALLKILALGQQQIAEGPGNTAIAVVERMQGDKPKVAKSCLKQWWFA